MEIEKILAIQPYKHESQNQRKEYSYNREANKKFIGYLNDANMSLGMIRADVACFQAGDSVMMQYDKMQSVGLRIRMKMERGE